MNELRRLLPWLQPHAIAAVGAVLLVFPVGLLRLVFPAMLKIIVDGVLIAKNEALLYQVTAAMFVLLVLQSAANVTQIYLLTSIGERVVAELRIALFERLARLDLRFFHNQRVGELVSRMTSDVASVQALISVQAVGVLTEVLMLGGSLVAIFFINARWSLVMLCIVPPVVLTARFFGKSLNQRTTLVQDRLAQAAGQMSETLSDIRTVKSFVRERHEEERFNGLVESALQAALTRARYRALFVPILLFLGFGGLIAVTLVGGQARIDNQVTDGALFSFLVYTLIIATNLGALGNTYGQFQEVVGALRRIFELLESRADVADPAEPISMPATKGAIRLEDVRFAYDGNPVLHGIDLDIAPGELLALVGPSGAGKTTLLNLIPRFHDPTAGRILLDGIDLRQLRTAELRDRIGLVPQDSLLFSRSIRENILYGRLDASPTEVEAAAKAARAHDFILALPDGYETTVGERGTKLSGGQRQRIAIARMLLKNPQIVLLDEATSALDSASEDQVQEAFHELFRGRTTIIIAHRLATVRMAHRVAVLDEGRVVELGTHAELLSRGGLYAHLHALQFRADRIRTEPPEPVVDVAPKPASA